MLSQSPPGLLETHLLKVKETSQHLCNSSASQEGGR
jgi:hypothetical protein